MKSTGFKIDLNSFTEVDMMYSDSTRQSVRTLYNKSSNIFIFKIYHPEEDYTEALLLENTDKPQLIFLGEIAVEDNFEMTTNISTLSESSTILGASNLLLNNATGVISISTPIEKQVLNDFNFKDYITTIYRNQYGELAIHELRDSHNQMMEIKVSFMTSDGSRHIRVVDRTEQQVQEF